jgi:CheY-like chemotaxis protein
MTEADILLVEDNPSDAELILDALASVTDIGRVVRVHDGVEALDFLLCRGAHESRVHEPPPRLVLLDIKLPRVEGLEVLAEIRRDERTRYVPVVVLTSSRIESDVRSAYELGANGYVQKPVDFMRVREVVHCLGRFWVEMNEPLPSVPQRPRISHSSG